MAAALRITYRKSAIGSRRSQRATLRSLGLRRLGQSRTVPDTPVFRGMIAQVRHLVSVEPVAPQATEAPADDGSSQGPAGAGSPADGAGDRG